MAWWNTRRPRAPRKTTRPRSHRLGVRGLDERLLLSASFPASLVPPAVGPGLTVVDVQGPAGDGTLYYETSDGTLLRYATAGGVAVPALANPGFEAPVVGLGSYDYNPNGAAWTFTGMAGVAANGSGFTGGNPNAPEGTQVAFIQDAGSMTQTVALTGGVYTLSFAAAQRATWSTSQTFEVLVDGQAVATVTPTGPTYATYTTGTFAVNAGSHTVTFVGLDPLGGDNTALIDQVQLNAVAFTTPLATGVRSFNLAADGTVTYVTTSGSCLQYTPAGGAAVAALADAGFESPVVGSSAFQYDPAGAGWTFTGPAGIAGDGSGFTAANPPAPEGAQVGFVQEAGSLSQSVTLAAGVYTFSFEAAQRANWSTTQTFQVLVDGQAVATVTPAGTSYASYTTAPFTVAAGSHTIAIVGLNPTGGDNTALVDQVQLNAVAFMTPLTMTASAVAVSATEGNSFSGVVATFGDGNPAAQSLDYSAVIAWGDGSTSAGTVSANPGGGWQVTGTHAYAEEGSYAPVVTVGSVFGASATATGTATVSDAALTTTDPAISATEGSTFNPVVATFSDGNPGGPAADYTATITWGDGSTSAGTVSASAGGGWQVTGTHAYAEEGSYNVVVSIQDVGGSSVTTTVAVAVQDATFSATGVAVNATEGSTFGGVVATLSDANPGAPASDYTATITWGDGSTSAGTVSACAGGGWQVSGSHSYAEEGSYTAVVSIRDVGGTTATVSDTAHVQDGALTAKGVAVSAAKGSAVSGVVATFTDANPGAPPTDYSATIAWGDGSTSTGTVSAAAGGGWQVSSSHTYAKKGSYTVSVSIQDLGGSTALATTTMTVGNHRKDPWHGLVALKRLERHLVTQLEGEWDRLTRKYYGHVCGHGHDHHHDEAAGSRGKGSRHGHPHHGHGGHGKR
jgi:hypothetical protein